MSCGLSRHPIGMYFLTFLETIFLIVGILATGSTKFNWLRLACEKVPPHAFLLNMDGTPIYVQVGTVCLFVCLVCRLGCTYSAYMAIKALVQENRQYHDELVKFKTVRHDNLTNFIRSRQMTVTQDQNLVRITDGRAID